MTSGDFDEDLAHRRGLDALECLLEVPFGDLQRVEHVGVDLLGLEIEFGADPPERVHRALAGERLEVGTDEAVRVLGVLIEVDPLVEGHPAGVDLQDLLATRLVGDADLDFAVEATAASERGSMASTRLVAAMTVTRRRAPRGRPSG